MLARTPLADLTRQAGESSEPAAVLEYLREVTFRVEQGNQAAEGDARRLAGHLDKMVAALPDIKKFATEHDELGRVIEYTDYTLNAIATGGEDIGKR